MATGVLEVEAAEEVAAVPRTISESPAPLMTIEPVVLVLAVFVLTAEAVAERGSKRWDDAESHPPATEQETNHSSIVR